MPIGYVTQSWVNGDTSKPLNATRLTHIEDGVKAAADGVDSIRPDYVSLKAAAKNPDLLIVGAVTVNSSGLITSAAVVWPDGTAGTLTITGRHSTGAVTDYNITYGSPVTKTFTQPTITRITSSDDRNGAATNVPQIVVS